MPTRFSLVLLALLGLAPLAPTAAQQRPMPGTQNPQRRRKPPTPLREEPKPPPPTDRRQIAATLGITPATLKEATCAKQVRTSPLRLPALGSCVPGEVELVRLLALRTTWSVLSDSSGDVNAATRDWWVAASAVGARRDSIARALTTRALQPIVCPDSLVTTKSGEKRLRTRWRGARYNALLYQRPQRDSVHLTLELSPMLPGACK